MADTITLGDLLTDLADQWGRVLPWTFNIKDNSDYEKVINKRVGLVTVTCANCGHRSSVTPSLLLSMKDDAGVPCVKCRGIKTTNPNPIAPTVVEEQAPVEKEESVEVEASESTDLHDEPVEPPVKTVTHEELITKALDHHKEVFGSVYFDATSFKHRVAGGKDIYSGKCLVCKQSVSFDSIEKLEPVSYKNHLLHPCPVCVSKIKKDGEYVAFRKIIDTYAANKSVTITNESVFSPIDVLTFECEDGHTFDMTFTAFSNTYHEVENVSEYLGHSFRESEDTTEDLEETQADDVVEEEELEEETSEEAISIEVEEPRRVTVEVSRAQDDTLNELEESRTAEFEADHEKSIFEEDELVFSKNPFEDQVSLVELFNASPFGSFMHDFQQKVGLNFQLRIDSSTLEVPVVDFENGYRVVCIDVDTPALYRVNLSYLTQAPFSYREHRDTYKYTFLYSDSVKARRLATLNALAKIINPEKVTFNAGKPFKVREKFNLMYTTDKRVAYDFDKLYSPSARGKPSNGMVTILARYDDTKKNMSMERLLMNLLNKDGRLSLRDFQKNMSIYAVCSLRYFDTYNRDDGTVTVYITDYIENTVSMFSDGLYVATAAMLKELQVKYPQVNFMTDFMKIRIIYERDISNHPSPTVKLYANCEDPLMSRYDATMKYLMEGNMGRIANEAWIRLPEFRHKEEDNFRHDSRYFDSMSTMINILSDEIKKSGISVRDKESKNKFLHDIGYRKMFQPEIEEYLLDSLKFMAAAYDPHLMTMVKFEPEAFTF